MPIPLFLAAAAAVAVAAYALSDDKPSSSGSSSDDDKAEDLLREAAEKKRKERERTQKQQAAHEAFQKQGSAFGQSLAQAIPSDLVEVRSLNDFTLNFDLKKRSPQFDMQAASQRDSDLVTLITDLETILTKTASHRKTIKNLVTFSELYKPSYFREKPALQIKKGRVICIDNEIRELEKIKAQLMKLANETVSA